MRGSRQRKIRKSLKEMESSFAMMTAAAHDTRRQRRRRTDDSVWNLLLFWFRITKTTIGRSTGMASTLCLKDFRSDWWDQTTGGWRVCHIFHVLPNFSFCPESGIRGFRGRVQFFFGLASIDAVISNEFYSFTHKLERSFSIQTTPHCSSSARHDRMNIFFFLEFLTP